MFEVLSKPHADPVKLPLTDSWWPVLIIIGSYLLFVLKLGRQYMSHRQPFDLKNVLKVYNLAQIFFNFTLFVLGSYFFFWVKGYNFNCLEVIPIDNPDKSFDRMITHLYYMNKIFDLFDTVIIILRKSYRQITVLHLVHHVAMVLLSYIYIRYNGYGGQPWFMAYLNVIVHCVMYAYYFLSSQYQLVKEMLWWKKYITILQMVQFMLIFAHSVWTYIQPNCDVSRHALNVILLVSFAMFVMFSNFYSKTYIQPNKKTDPNKSPKQS